MSNACPVPPPAERQCRMALDEIEQTMMRQVHAAIEAAAEQARQAVAAAGLDLPSPSSDYYAASIHQKLYCHLCKADPETFEGGRADIAMAIIRNSQNIARHYWGADIVKPSTPAAADD
jgi:hypothetical protein